MNKKKAARKITKTRGKQPTLATSSSKAQTSGSWKRPAVCNENESSLEEEYTYSRRRKSKKSWRRHDVSEGESDAEGNAAVDEVEVFNEGMPEVEEVDVEAGNDVSGMAVSLFKWNLQLWKGLAKRHRATIPDEEEDEDTTRDIQMMFSDIVKVLFNKVDGKGNAVEDRKAELCKGRWCLICRLVMIWHALFKMLTWNLKGRW